MKTLFLLDKQSAMLSIRERILYFILLIFFFTLYMPGITWMYNVLMYAIFVFSFFFNSLKQKWAILKSRKAILIIIIFFLLNCFSALISADRKVGIAFVGLRLSLFVLPVSLGSLYIHKQLKDRIIFAFAIATFIASIGSLCWGIFRALKLKDASLLYNDNLSLPLNLQSIYFAMFLNLAFFSFIYLLLTKSDIINVKAIISMLIILFIVHFLLASRIAIINLYSTVFLIAVYFIIREKRFLQGLGLIILLGVGSFLMIKIFPQTVNRFQELNYTKFDFKSTAKESHFSRAVTADQWNGANTRIAIWDCAWIIIKDNLLFGVRLGDKKEALRQEYIKKDFREGLNKNTHNNYLDVWMSLGLFGLIIFLTGFFLLPLVEIIKCKDWYGLIIVIAFMSSLFTETYMDRTMGNTMLAFFLCFITSYKMPSNKKIEIR